MTPPFQIDLFHGQLSVHSAQVYARVADLPGGQEWTITGRVRGPECRHAKSLPANYPFVDLGAGDTLLARATLPDPCFWSPDLPALYRVTVELKRGGERMQTQTNELGWRFLGTRGRSFYLEGKRWVLRAVHQECVEPASLAAWREAGAAMLVDDPSDELCQQAAQEGVFLVARVTGEDPARLRRLSHSASVAIVLLGGSGELFSAAQRQVPNVLLGAIAADSNPPAECSALFCDAARFDSPGFQLAAIPSIAVRNLRHKQPLANARLECDQLQRDLARLGDFAGYVIDRSRHAPVVT